MTEAPRQLIELATNGNGAGRNENPSERTSALQELPRNRTETACCGGGGGRMWFDDAIANRVGQGRIREIAAAGTDAVAVGCPFCLIMLGDGLAAAKPEMRVRDVAEILAESLLGPETTA